MKEITEQSDCFVIQFDYDKKIVEGLKTIPQREFNWQNKTWIIPKSLNKEVEQFAKLYKFNFKKLEVVRVDYHYSGMPELKTEIPLKLSLYDYQRQGVAYNLIHKRTLIGDQMGLGKAQPLTSKIATPKGWVEMGSLIVGSEIFGFDGKVQKVVSIHPQGIRPTYRVSFNDGFSVECDEDHLWSIRDINRKKRGSDWSVKSTKEIISMGLTYKLSKQQKEFNRNPSLKFEIPITSPVEFQEKEYLIHPYVIGVLIGDGYLAGKDVCFSTPNYDNEIVTIVKNNLPDKYKLRVNECPACPQYYITKTEGRGENIIRSEISKLKLDVKSRNKFIPEIYLQGSINQRIDLLRGLMDSDGSARNNKISFSSTSENLAFGISELVQSLGGQASVKKYYREGKGLEYRINVRLGICPFYLKRKAVEWHLPLKNYMTRKIQSIEYIGEKECQCIKVSNINSLYLTDNYIVTHNTCQAIATVKAANAFPCLVVCPSSLRINWEREWEMWTDHKAMILSDSIKNTWDVFYKMKHADIFIVNYESLKKYFVLDIEKKKRKEKLNLKDVSFSSKINLFKSIIVDESHRVKEITAQQTVFTAGLAANKEYRFLISGTPVQNKPDDLIAQLAILGQLSKFGGMSAFKEKYCGKEPDFDELQYLLKENCFYRREKSEVLKELPPKTRQVILCDITTRTEYNHALEDLREYLIRYKNATDKEVRKAMRGEVMVRIGILKEISARGKLSTVAEYISDVIESGEKIIMFSHLIDIQKQLKKLFPSFVTVVGEDDMQTRQRHIDAFQNDPKVQGIICSIKAAGVGITLTASSIVGHIELPWHPADSDQDEDRAHRKGQYKNVTCPYFIGKDTIDEYIYGIIQEKREMSNAITGAKDDVEVSIQNGLINFLSSNL